MITKLTGRYLEFEIHTLDFAEFLDMKKFYQKPVNSNLLIELNEYILNGGFPYALQLDEADAKRTYIENVIEANLKACLAPHEAAGEAFNIAYGGREYLIDIYYGLTKALEVDIEPNYGPDRAGDIKHSNANIEKARRLLGYDPDWSFDRGIAAAIDWYREHLA